MKDFITREELTQALEHHFSPGRHDTLWAARTAEILFNLAEQNTTAIKRFTDEEVAGWLIQHGSSLAELRGTIHDALTDITSQAQEIENLRAEITELRGWFGQALLTTAKQAEAEAMEWVPDDGAER